MLKLMRSKLSVRLALLFLVASLLPLVAATVLALKLMRTSLHEEADRRHEEVAQLCGSVVEVWLDSTSDKLLALAEVMRVDLLERQIRPGEEVSEAAMISLQNRIAPLIDSNDNWKKQTIPALEVEFFYNRQGVPQPKSKSGKNIEPPHGNVNVQNRQWIAQNVQPAVQQQVASRKGGRAESPLVQQPMATGELYCEAVIEVIDGTPTLAMSAPVGAFESNFGALVADIDFTELRDMLGQLAGDGFTITVVDEAGTALFEMGSDGGEALSETRDIGSSGWEVTVAEQLSVIEAPLDEMRRQASLWGIAASLLAIVLSFGLSAGITRPVRVLQRAAEAMESGDLSTRTNLNRQDEIGQLAASFDRMANALDHLDTAKSEFVGNVSHELRTPLTSMRLSIGNLMDGVVGELNERQERTLGRVQRELNRMIKMVSELLEMAKLEAGMVDPIRLEIDLNQLANDCAAMRMASAQEREISIVVQGLGQALGDPAMVRRMLDNLLDNALKFSPDKGTVSITIEGSELRVSDQGPGFEAGQANEMFGKFRQGTIQGVKQGGVGLGLAIVARLAALNEGDVRIEERAPGETGASLILALAKVNA